MKRSPFILLIMFFLVGESTPVLHAQAVIEGRVIDIDSKEPLRGTHVFLSGTKIGTSTDTLGNYMLKGIPSGAHRLVVSMIGYGRKTYDLTLGPEDNKTMDFALNSIVYEMNEIYAGNLDEKWKKRLEHFEELFLGETKWAESVIILNPEVLRFNANFW
ncbi:MAG: carboxypeptidase-like regulatory domain-containing protein, partial [Balneolaceae bacterium]|nr:carboxypeptidase-like regulatory domain-containing protein [Balneolaceae bacterium]